MGFPKIFAFVFSMLIITPEHRLNLFNNFRAYSIDFRSCTMRVRSSANTLILIIVLSHLIPLMFLSYLILLARLSIAKINKYADRGHHCLTPLSSLKYPPVLPLLITVDSILLCHMEINTVPFCFINLN